MIGIIGALDEEIALINKSIENCQISEKAQFRFFSGKIGEKEVTAVKCGIGKVNAALCTQILVDVFNCEKIIFGGVAGSLLPGLNQGDIVVSSHAVQFDVDLTAFGRRRGETPGHDRLIEADSKMVNAVSDAFDDMFSNKTEVPNFMVGTIVSGDKFVSDPKTIKWLQREFGAVCTEMEGGALAYACQVNDIPFVIIRVISDSGGKEAVKEFELFLSKSSKLLCHLITLSINQF